MSSEICHPRTTVASKAGPLPWWPVLLGLFLLGSGGTADAEPGPTLRVGINDVPPFVMRGDDGTWQGISLELWDNIATSLALDYTLIPMPFQELLAAVEAGRVDVAVGAITMTADREQRFDFTHPFYQTGLAIAVPQLPRQSLWHTLRAFLSLEFLQTILALGGLLLIFGTLMWLVEYRRNPGQFQEKPVPGIGAGFWWAAVTMTTVGYGDKAPLSFPGRLIGLIWMFTSVIILASFTAAITSSLTVKNLQTSIRGPEDLPGKVVATLADTASQAYLQEHHIQYKVYPELSIAMRAVASGEVQAILYDHALLQYLNPDLGADALSILPGLLARQSYALAMPPRSELRASLSEQVLEVLESDEWSAIQARYLGSGN